MTQMQAKVRTQMRALLARHGFELGSHKDLLGEEVQRWLEGVQEHLNPQAQRVLGMWRAMLPVLAAHAEALEPVVEREAPGSAGAVAAEPAGSGLATGADDGGRDR